MQGTSVQASEDVAIAADLTAAVIVKRVELIGHLDEGGPAGVIRLFEQSSRVGRYVDIRLKDILGFFPEGDVDPAAAQTVITVRGKAQLLICTPVQAARLGEDIPTDAGFWPRR